MRVLVCESTIPDSYPRLKQGTRMRTSPSSLFRWLSVRKRLKSYRGRQIRSCSEGVVIDALGTPYPSWTAAKLPFGVGTAISTCLDDPCADPRPSVARLSPTLVQEISTLMRRRSPCFETRLSKGPLSRNCR